MSKRQIASQSISGAIDAIGLDMSWQRALTEDECVALMTWAEKKLSGNFEQMLLDVRMKLAEIGRMSEADRGKAIEALNLTCPAPSSKPDSRGWSWC